MMIGGVRLSVKREKGRKEYGLGHGRKERGGGAGCSTRSGTGPFRRGEGR